MPPSDDLVAQREHWITTICAGLVGQFERHSVLGSVSSDLGAPGLVRAMVVVRIAALTAGGHSAADIGNTLAESRIFRPSPQSNDVAGLVERVRKALGRDRITDQVALWGTGLHSWNPEGVYQFLLEVWSEQRLASDSSTLKRELTQHWGVREHDALEACLGRCSKPLAAYPNVWVRLKDETDMAAGNLAALALSGGTKSRYNAPYELWADRLAFDINKATHLFDVGGHWVRLVHARRHLRSWSAWSDLGSDERSAAARALKVIDDEYRRVATCIEGLTTLERDLLRERTDEERFQDACVAAVIDWAGNAETVVTPSSAPVHGMWGPLPWCSITVTDEQYTQALTAALAKRTLPLGYARDADKPQRVDLLCRSYRSDAPGLTVRFGFDLTNPVHAAELLLIGRRGEICVDVLKEIADSNDRRGDYLGTLSVTAIPESARSLAAIASSALRELVPTDRKQGETGRGLDSCGDGPWPTEGLCFDTWMSARELVTAHSDANAGEITLDFESPVVSGKTRTARVSSVRAGRFRVGFVYALRNRAFPQMVKIGYTDKLVDDRADELSTTGVPFPNEVLVRVVTLRPREVEQAVHRMLRAHRVSPHREFFYVDERTAEEAIRSCRDWVTGIDGWEPMPVLHRLRAGDRVTLPLRANQMFAITAYEDGLLSSRASGLDVWQAHTDGDTLELHITDEPGHVSGFSHHDPGGIDDPVPFLNRNGTAPNGHLIGKERLTAGDRLSWLEQHEGTSHCTHVLFEISGFCQVTCRTWHPKSTESGMPLLLNHMIREASPAMIAAVHEVLALGPPRNWAPRNPDPDDWVSPATQPQSPEYWMKQLRNPGKRR